MWYSCNHNNLNNNVNKLFKTHDECHKKMKNNCRIALFFHPPASPHKLKLISKSHDFKMVQTKTKSHSAVNKPTDSYINRALKKLW